MRSGRDTAPAVDLPRAVDLPLVIDAVWAAVATLALAVGWQHLAPADDGLRGVAQMTPWVVVLLRWAARRATGRVDRFLPVAAGAALAALLLRHRVGVAEPETAWLVALLVLLGVALGRLLPDLRRLLPRSRPASAWPDRVFLLLPLGIYLAIQPWALEHRSPDGDEPYYLLIAHSLADDFDTDLSDEYRERSWRRFSERPIEPQPGDPRSDDGSIHSRHAPFLPLLLAPAYALFGRAGASAFIALAAALVAWLTLALARRRWPEKTTGALLAWATLAFTPPLLIYAHQIWIEVPAALCAILALERLDALTADSRAGRALRRRDLIAFAVALAALPLLKMRLLLVAVPLLVLALWRLRRELSSRSPTRSLGWVAIPPLAAVAALFAYNAARFDNPLRMYGRADVKALASAPADYVRGLVGVFWDCAFGLFGAAPIWLLLLPALWLLARRALRKRDPLLGELALVGLPTLLAIAPRLEWYGGWAPPFRYPLVLLPLLALALVPLLDRRTTLSRVAAAALVPVSILVAAIVVAVPGWAYHLADGGSIPLHLLGYALQADVVRLFPSAVRPRPATWIWVVGTLVLAPLVASTIARRPLRRHAWTAGIVVLCLAVAALPLLAQRLPTHRVEVEDWWVRKTRGEVVPEQWVVRRPTHRGGWLVPAGGSLSARIAPGGERVTLRLEAARRGFRGPNTLEIRAGDRLLDTWSVEGDGWRTRTIGPVDWPAGAPLLLTNPQRSRRDTVGVVVDRIELDWQ